MLGVKVAAHASLAAAAASHQQLIALPSTFNDSQWAWVSNENPLLAVIPGQFNRSGFDAPSAAKVSDSRVAAINEHINQTSFVAYDPAFFDIIGPKATLEQLTALPFQVHEAPCYIPETSQLFFTQWGPPGGGVNGGHDYQFLLDLKTNNLTTVKTNPPTWNVHGCVYNKGKLHVVTDGGPNESAYVATIDPKTWERTTILNNYYEQPFMSFNDLDMDREGNYYVTDSLSGWGRDLNPYNQPVPPTAYFINGTTLRIKPLIYLEGNTNGISLSPDGGTLYLADTGASRVKPSGRAEAGQRDLWAFDLAVSKKTGQQLPLLTNRRLLTRSIQYFYDGVRASRNGWIFGAGGDSVDVVDPESGWVLGSIRFGGGQNAPVNLVFGENELWVVGKGGVWHVKDISDKLKRDW